MLLRRNGRMARWIDHRACAARDKERRFEADLTRLTPLIEAMVNDVCHLQNIREAQAEAGALANNAQMPDSDFDTSAFEDYVRRVFRDREGFDAVVEEQRLAGWEYQFWLLLQRLLVRKPRAR